MIDRQLVLDLFRLRRAFTKSSPFDFDKCMLRSEFFVLQVLIHHEDDGYLSVSQIADTLNLSNPAISRTIKGLDERKWIERHNDPEDRRTAYIDITEEGNRNYTEVVNRIVMKIQDALRDYDEEDLRIFIKTGLEISEIINNINYATDSEEVMTKKGVSE